MNRPNYQDTPDTFYPSWASAYGQDQFGYWADLVLDENKGAKQRFRWIPAGQFMMGSPANEVWRRISEDYHQETLTQGFWLADTACSQAFWMAVTGDSPVHFELSEQHPAVNASWLDVEKFIQRLNKQIGHLNAILPSEAQWEYACRAGTTTAFNMGDSITAETVNFNDSHLHTFGDSHKSEYRKKTVAVNTLNQNDWGLYQMHGNVWEWCHDHWQAELEAAAITDQFSLPDGEKDHRVVRGGSWVSNATHCRSAYRHHFEADLHYYYVGFRLALGQELQSSAGGAS